MDAIFPTTFLNAFSWTKMYKFRLGLNWSLFFPKGPINNIPTLVQIVAWCRPSDKQSFEPMMNILLAHTWLGLNELIDFIYTMALYHIFECNFWKNSAYIDLCFIEMCSQRYQMTITLWLYAPLGRHWVYSEWWWLVVFITEIKKNPPRFHTSRFHLFPSNV